jgi:hypothetical protein
MHMSQAMFKAQGNTQEEAEKMKRCVIVSLCFFLLGKFDHL